MICSSAAQNVAMSLQSSLAALVFETVDQSHQRHPTRPPARPSASSHAHARECLELVSTGGAVSVRPVSTSGKSTSMYFMHAFETVVQRLWLDAHRGQAGEHLVAVYLQRSSHRFQNARHNSSHPLSLTSAKFGSSEISSGCSRRMRAQNECIVPRNARSIS